MRFPLLRLYLIITCDANWRSLAFDLGKPSCFSDCLLPFPDHFRSVSLAESSSCINRFRSFLSSIGWDVTILAWIGCWRFDCHLLNDDFSVFGLSVFFALGESGAPYKVVFLPFQMACSSGFLLLLTLEEYFPDVHDDVVSLVVRGWLWPFILFSNDRCYHSFKLNFSLNFLFYYRKASLYIYVHFDLVPKQVPWFALKFTGLQLIYFWWLFGFLEYLIVVTKLFSVMEKGKKPLFSAVLCTEASQATVLKSDPIQMDSNNERGFKPLPSDQMINQNQQPSIPKPKDKIIVDSKTLFNRLANAREQAKKQKELTLVACIMGNPMDLPKVYAKLRIDWRFAKGEFRFSDLKGGWFGSLFSNPLDLKKIWENRPYHISGQLLLLKKWYVGFNPVTESKSNLDLWIRIHKLPSEYANADALSAILEMNKFGSFIKIDPIHVKRNWMTFTRLCVNTDVQLNTGRKIIIPDDDMIERKYNVWFDDFPMGCGACGELDHEFESCPERALVPPKIQITLPKPSSKNKHISPPSVPSGSKDDWTVVGEKGEGKNMTKANPNINKPYLADNSGFSIVYISDESSDGTVEAPEPKEKHMKSIQPNKSAGTSERLIEVFTIDTPDNEEAEPQRNGVTLQDELYNPANIQRGHNKQAANPDGHNNQADTQGNLQTLSPNDELMECGILLCSSFLREVILLENGILFLDPIEPEINDLEGEVVEVEFLPDEEEAEPFEDPEEDVDEPNDTDPLPTIPDTDTYQMAPLFQEDEPLFTDEEFSALLDADMSFDPPNPDLSESTFHSIHNSMLSSSSMVNMLGSLEMNQNTITHSSSSKRKSNEGVEDTATSILMGFKKKRT